MSNGYFQNTIGSTAFSGMGNAPAGSQGNPGQLAAVPAVNLDFETVSTGVTNLPLAMTINSQTVYPSLCYRSQDATLVNWPGYEGYGPTLLYHKTTTDAELDYKSPFNDGTKSVRFAEDGYYQEATASGEANVGTNDIVIEWVSKNVASSSRLAGCSNSTAGSALKGWLIRNVGTQGSVNLYESSGVTPAGPAVGTNSWQHHIAFCDRSGSAVVYTNGFAGTPVSLAAVTASLDDSRKMTIGAANNGDATTINDHVAWIAMWQGAAWLNTHLQATIAGQRFALLTGAYDSVSGAMPITTSATRSGVANINVYDSVADTMDIVPVSNNWPRVESLKISGTRVQGFRSETGPSNRLTYSEDFGNAAWSKSNVTVTDVSTTISSPTGTAWEVLASSTASNIKHVSQLNDATSNVALSVLAKAGANGWLAIRNNGNSIGMGWFDLVNGVVGSDSGADLLEHGMLDYGDGWWLCWSRCQNSGAGSFYMYTSPDDDGTGANHAAADTVTPLCYIAFTQKEAVGAATHGMHTSYIKTTSAAVTRSVDYFRWPVGSLLTGTAITSVVKIHAPSHAGSNGTLSIVGLNSSTNFLSHSTPSITNYLSCSVTVGGSAQASFSSNVDYIDGYAHTARITYEENSAFYYVDGVQVGSEDTSCVVPLVKDNLFLGCREVGNIQFIGGLICKAVLHNTVYAPGVKGTGSDT